MVLKKSEKFLIGLLILVLILYGFYQILYAPLLMEIEMIEAENILLSNRSKTVDFSKNSELESAELEQDMSLLLEQVPFDADLSNTIAYLQESAAAAQVVLAGINCPGDALAASSNSGAAEGAYKTIKLDLTIYGSYQGIKDFMIHLESKSRRIYHLKEICLQTRGANFHLKSEPEPINGQSIFESAPLTAKIVLFMYYDQIEF